MRANKKKLESVILYILQNYNNKNLTETKLQKLLYYCDFNYYAKTLDSSITGYAYHKNHHGPTIKNLPTILGEMEQRGLIKKVQGKNYYGSVQTNFTVTTVEEMPELDFGSRELLTMREVNEAYMHLTPTEIRLLSHQDFPYAATGKKNQIIDYSLVRYRDDYSEDALEEKDAEASKLFASQEFANLLQKVEAKL